MKKLTKTIDNERGFVLIVSLLMLTVLMIIGIAATNTTTIELQISGNDKINKTTFYAADGGLDIGAELVEQSIWDFPSKTLPLVDGVARLGHLSILGDYTLLQSNPYFDPQDIDIANPDAFFSYSLANSTATTIPRIDLWVAGRPVHGRGGSLQQLAGYSGSGKGAAGGGSATKYNIHSIAYGPNNSRTSLLIQWLHAL